MKCARSVRRKLLSDADLASTIFTDAWCTTGHCVQCLEFHVCIQRGKQSWERVKQEKKPRRPRIRPLIRVGDLIDLTTFSRNETTMEVTILKHRIDEDNEDDEEHGPVPGGGSRSACSENGDRSVAYISQHNQ